MNRTGFPHVAEQTHEVFYPTFRVHKGSVICIFRYNIKGVRERNLEGGSLC